MSFFKLWLILADEDITISKEIPDSCRIADSDCDLSVFDADESDSNAPSSESGLSTQVSNASSRGRGRQKKLKRGPVPGQKNLGN